jgi:hypothetical protein
LSYRPARLGIDSCSPLLSGSGKIQQDAINFQYEKKYDIPERILFMALESVLYDEDQVRE